MTTRKSGFSIFENRANGFFIFEKYGHEKTFRNIPKVFMFDIISF